MGIHWDGTYSEKVELVAYVHPRVKEGMKIAATLEKRTVSSLVEELCIEYLRGKKGIGDLIEKGR